jgi:hypothetical protein
MHQHHQPASWIARALRSATFAFMGLVAMIAGNAARAGTPSLEVISAWGGPVNDVEVAPGGNIAYIGSGRRLVVANISNLAAITEIGSIDLRFTVCDIAIQGNLAYVATNYHNFSAPASFHVVDISNPAAPLEVWNSASTPLASGQIDKLCLHGNCAYLRHDTDGEHPGLIDVYDLSQPAAPVRLGYIENIVSLNSQASQMEVVGDRLYVFGAPDGSGLAIYDLNSPNPLQPALLGTLRIGGECKDLAVDGDYAYLSIGSDAVRPISIVNVSNPASPTLVSTSVVQAAGTAHGISAFNGYLYVSNWNFPTTEQHFLRIYDVGSNPAVPIELPTYATHGDIRDIVFSDGRGWVLDDGEGAIALDITNPASLTRLGNYYSPARLTGMDKPTGGNLLYVVDEWNGFTILDVSNPKSMPVVVGIFQTPTPATLTNAMNWAIDVVGDRAYFSAGYNGFMVVDVSNPASTTLLFTGFASPSWPGSSWRARSVQVVDEIIYVAFTGAGWCGGPPALVWGMHTYNATTMALLGQAFLGCGYAESVAVNDQGIMFTGGNPPEVVDASNPSAPVLINSDAGPSLSNSVALEGNVRLLARAYHGAGAGLYLHDVSTPANPAQLASAPTSGELSWLALQNHRAYVLENSSNCHVYDVSNPQQPQPIVTLNPDSGVILNSQIVVDEPNAFISSGRGWATWDTGLLILRGENLELPPQIEANKMYWADNGGSAIRRANTNGTGVETLLDASDGVLSPSALALDLVNAKMYFPYDLPAGVDNTKIQRANLDGSGIEDVLVGLNSISPIVIRLDVAGGKIYWLRSTAAASRIHRANLDGTGSVQLFQLSGITGFDLDIVNGKIYWSQVPSLACLPGECKIQRSNLDGTSIEDVLVGLDPMARLRIDRIAGKMYWSSAFLDCGTLQMYRANLDGSMVELLPDGCCHTQGLDIDHSAGKMYLNASSTIKRANLDGSGLEDLITAGVSSSNSIQVVSTQPEPCPADVTGNGTVNVDDLLLVINNWGQTGSNPADVTGNGVVNIDDLLAVINAWGACK